MRHDVYGEFDEATNSLILRSFGFFDDHTEYGSTLSREPNADGAPDINIDLLESIPSVE